VVHKQNTARLKLEQLRENVHDPLANADVLSVRQQVLESIQNVDGSFIRFGHLPLD
jgi:hypothetical protein